MSQLNFLFSPIAHALGITLLSSLWQAFIVFFFLKLFLRFVPNTTAKHRYAVSFLSYIGTAVWSFVTFIQQVPLRQNELLAREIPEPNAGTQLAAPFYPGHAFEGFSLSSFDNYLPWLTAIYLVGVLCFSARLMLSYFFTIRLRTEGLLEMESAFMDRLWLLATKMEVSKPVFAYISKYVVSPVVIGFFKPMILLPVAAVNNLSASQMEAVLLHELAHVRRNDYLLNLFQSVLDILLFFNPFAYWISKNIRAERELCCDEMVLQLSDPYQYAKALLTLEESGQNNHRLAMGANNKSTQLLNRIKNIMEMQNKHINLKQKLIALAIIVAGTISVAWLVPEENKTSRTPSNNHVLKNKSLIKINKTQPVFFKQIVDEKEIEDTSYPKVVPPPPPPPSAPVAIIAPVAPVAPVPPAAVAPVPAPPKSPGAPKPPVPPLPKNRSAALPADTMPSTSNYFKSPEFQKQMEAAKKSADEMRKYFESDAWKKQQKSIQKSAEALNNYFKSPQWKHQLDTMQKNSLAINQYFNSDGWKKQQHDIQKNAEKTQAYFNSEAWKNQQKEIQKSAEKLQKYFNSDGWKKQQIEIQKSAEKAQEYFKSDQWKKQQIEIQKSTEKAQKYFNSDEWKKQQIEIQKNAEKTQEYFKSDQWKKQQEDLKRSMDSLGTTMNKDA